MPRAKKKETEAPAGAVTETVQRMPLSELHPFEGHPFKVLDDDSMTETVESIRQMGVANPLIVRPDPDGGYEIISGHRRRHAAELAGLDTIPVIVRELDDDAAVIMMVDSNLQRENILPSERAKAYKMKLEALKHQGQRHDLTSTQVVEKERIAACVAELQRLEQQQERYKQEKFRAYENFSGGTLTKDAYLKQREEIDSRLAAAKVEQEAQEQLLSGLERQVFQDKEQKDDVFNSFAGATELTAEMAGTFIKEVRVSSPTEIEIDWKFRDVFGGHFGTKEEEVDNG